MRSINALQFTEASGSRTSYPPMPAFAVAERPPVCRERKAFTLVELLIVIGIIAVLISILLPALNRARAQATSIQCQSNLRQIGIAASTYSNDYKGSVLPCLLRSVAAKTQGGSAQNDSWPNILVEFGYMPRQNLTNTSNLASNSAFLCPSTPDIITDFSTYDGYWTNTSYATETSGPPNYTPTLFTQSSYGINGAYSVGQGPLYDISTRNVTNFFPTYGIDLANPQPNVKITQIRDSSNVVFIFDGLYVNPVGSNLRIVGRHFGSGKTTNTATGRTNILFLDGHVDSYLRSQLPTVADNAAGFWAHVPGSAAAATDRPIDPVWKILTNQ